MVNIQEVYRTLRNILHKAGIEDDAFEANQLIEFVLGKSRFAVDEVNQKDWDCLQQFAQKRAQRYPLQYLLGTWDFMGLSFFVGEGVLIPRPETEEVCEQALALINAEEKPMVLDLCAGSGALALGIQSRKPLANVIAVELSEKAFYYLQKNCAFFSKEWQNVPVCKNADVFQFQNCLETNAFDLIVSNPPYVTATEYTKLEEELFYEPKMALVEPEDGLAFYRHIAKAYRDNLKYGGCLVFEIGAEQGKDVYQIMKKLAYRDIQVIKDLAGNDRTVCAIK